MDVPKVSSWTNPPRKMVPRMVKTKCSPWMKDCLYGEERVRFDGKRGGLGWVSGWEGTDLANGRVLGLALVRGVVEALAVVAGRDEGRGVHLVGVGLHAALDVARGVEGWVGGLVYGVGTSYGYVRTRRR